MHKNSCWVNIHIKIHYGSLSSKTLTSFLHCSQCSPEIISFQIMICWHSLKKLHVNATKNMQSLLYICFLLSGCVKYNKKFPCGKSLFREKTLTHYHHRTMSGLSQYKKYIAAYIHCRSTKNIQATGRPPLIMIHHPPLKFPLSWLKILFLQKLHTVGFPTIVPSLYHWNVACGSCKLQQTKTSLGMLPVRFWRAPWSRW